MRAFATCIVALGLIAMPAIAGAAGSGDKNTTAANTSSNAAGNSAASSAPAAGPNTEAPAKAESSSVEIEVDQLRELVESQAKQLHDQELKMAALENRLNNTGSPAGESFSASPANIAPAATPVVTPNAAVVSTPAAPANAGQTGEATGPASLSYKGITLTPGGFFVAESVWRQHALSADVNTPFNAAPFPGSSQSRVSEFNASGRQSRISMLAEGKLSNMKIGGYYELDFLSAGVTSNDNQSNSYTMRHRQFWAQAALNSGWTFTGGQMWSLVTETKKGLDNRTEAAPMTIDAQYTIGFSWARQYGFRVAKNFDNKMWLGFAVESPQTTFAVHGQSNNYLIGAAGNGGGLFNSTANYTFSAAPDVIVKAAFEPGFGHYEVFGVLSTFRDRVFPTGGSPSNDSRVGGGIGVNARVTWFKKLDTGIHFFGGSGVGRYGTGGLPDATVRPDGTLALIHSYQGLGTIEYHGSKFDIYLNGGAEYAGRTAYTTGLTTAVGYGSPLFNNSGCWTEPNPGSGGFVPGSLTNCTGDTRNLIEGTVGFWYRFYKGPKGTLQWGPQYSYYVRNTWRGVGSVANPSGAPQGSENMFFTSFRYYLP